MTIPEPRVRDGVVVPEMNDPLGWCDRREVLKHRREQEGQMGIWLAQHSDEKIMKMCQTLTVLAFDPGGTTGWALMQGSLQDIVNKEIPAHLSVSRWFQGQLDCGANSGNAADSGTADGQEFGISESGEAAGVAIMENMIESSFRIWGPPAVVVEDFILRTQNKSRDALSPVRLTAALDQLLWESGIAKSIKQQPSEAKTAIPDSRLNLWNMSYGTRNDRHGIDATRHALLFFRKMKAKPSIMRGVFPQVEEAKKRGLL